MPELTATLVISRSHSYCGNCREETLPRATHHTDISGWTPEPGKGCGARFVDMRSDNGAVTGVDLKSIRPDLPLHVDPEA